MTLHDIQRPIAALSLAAALLGAGCAQRTQFVTTPSGATIWVDGAPIGVSPVSHTSRSGPPREFEVRIEKPGFRAIELVLRSEYRADESLFLLPLLIIPYFYSARLEDEYRFVLVTEDGSVPGAAATSAATGTAAVGPVADTE